MKIYQKNKKLDCWKRKIVILNQINTNYINDLINPNLYNRMRQKKNK